METKIQVKPIGKVIAENGNFCIKLDEQYIPALTNIEGFSHIQVVWWGNLFDNPNYRKQLVTNKPYKKSPEKLGVFATRSQIRPNPILITTIMVMDIDYEKGLIYTPYIDAENNTPVLDIKPYHFIERIKDCSVPQWCAHWPKWYEDAATFDWEDEFNF